MWCGVMYCGCVVAVCGCVMCGCGCGVRFVPLVFVGVVVVQCGVFGYVYVC